MAKARPIPGLAADTRFGDAAAAAIEVRTTEVFERSAHVLDVDAVHDMRVATRRLRAALEVFAPCFPRKRHRRLLREVKRLADALGARRDPDVAIIELRELASELPEAETAGAESLAGIDALVAELRDEQSAGDTHVRAVLAEARDSDLEARLLELAGKARR